MHCHISALADFKIANSDDKAPLQPSSYSVLDRNPVICPSAADHPCFTTSDEEGEYIALYCQDYTTSITLYHIFVHADFEFTAKIATSDKSSHQPLSNPVLNRNPVSSMPTVNDPISLLTSDEDGISDHVHAM